MNLSFLKNKVIVTVVISIVLFVIAFKGHDAAITLFSSFLGNVRVAPYHSVTPIPIKMLFAACIAATPLLGMLLVLGFKLANPWKNVLGVAIIILVSEILFASARIFFIRSIYQNQHFTIGHEQLRLEESMLIGCVIGFCVLGINAARLRSLSNKKTM
jgi:hypothetical protein